MEQGNAVWKLSYIGFDGYPWESSIEDTKISTWFENASDPDWKHHRSNPTVIDEDLDWIGYISPDNGQHYATTCHTHLGTSEILVQFRHYRVTTGWQANNNPTRWSSVESTTDYIDFIAADGSGWRARMAPIILGSQPNLAGGSYQFRFTTTPYTVLGLPVAPVLPLPPGTPIVVPPHNPHPPKEGG